MEILKRNSWFEEITCTCCKSRLKIVVTDIYFSWKGVGDRYLYVRCAACKQQVNLTIDIPSSIDCNARRESDWLQKPKP